MVSGGVDGLFDGAAAVEICGNKLLGEVSILKHDVSKLFSIFVFKDLVFHYMATLLDMYYDAVMRWQLKLYWKVSIRMLLTSHW